MIDWNNDPLEQTIPDRKAKSPFWDYVVPIFCLGAVIYFFIGVMF